jgi:hypothetical protein
MPWKSAGYILEVQRFDSSVNPEEMGKFQHIGYMKKLFKTKKEAAEYYDDWNPGMRKLNHHHTWCSDWNPTTHLRYIVREHHGEYLTIDSWN